MGKKVNDIYVSLVLEKHHKIRKKNDRDVAETDTDEMEEENKSSDPIIDPVKISFLYSRWGWLFSQLPPVPLESGSITDAQWPVVCEVVAYWNLYPSFFNGSAVLGELRRTTLDDWLNLIRNVRNIANSTMLDEKESSLEELKNVIAYYEHMITQYG